MLLPNLCKFSCMQCLRIIGLYSRNFSSSYHTKEVTTNSTPVPLAYSEYLADDDTVITDSPIFILHGLLGSRANWNSASKRLAAVTRRKIITLDLRNHGDSPHTDEFSYHHMMADVKLLMDELDVKDGKSTVLGHSIGGRVAMTLALEYPDKIRDLVIVDISPLGFPPGVKFVPRLLDALASITLKPENSLLEARKDAVEQMKKFIRGEKLRTFLVTNLIIDPNTNKFVWKINIESIKANYSSLIAFPIPKTTFSSPCLFIASERSGFLKRDDESKIREMFPKAQFEYISDVGHLIHHEKPDQFIDVVHRFLNNNITDVK